ncbi:MAG TPA: hypothetical protein VGD99_00960 [Anaerolineae bacterium]
MSKFSTTKSSPFTGSQIESCLKDCRSLEEAAQKCIDTIYEEFKESLVLLRMFVSVSYSELPRFNQKFVTNLAEEKGIVLELKNETPILCLIGTRGEEPEWNEWRKSKGHIGIPLVSTEFIETIPMVSRLLSDLGLNLNWINNPDSGLDMDVSGNNIAGIFFVEDAKESTDSKKRKIIPMQDFVKTHNVCTVFGIGGRYMLGRKNIVTVIFFTKEKFSKATTHQFVSLINLFKISTMKFVSQNRIFSDERDIGNNYNAFK